MSGYPRPVLISSDKSVSGYFLKADYSNIAVLSIPIFAPKDPQEFQDVVNHFLAACRSQGKTRHIVDVRGNGGATVYFSYDTFMRLFPDTIPYSGVRSRAAEAVNIIETEASKLKNVNSSVYYSQSLDYLNLLQYPNGANMTSCSAFYGPIQSHDDHYTYLTSWNLPNFGVSEEKDTDISA